MENQKHSGIGIASFIVSLISGIFIFLIIMIAGVMESSTPGGMNEESAGAIMIGLLLLAFMGTSVVAFSLGVGGLMQKDREKLFAILGTAFSAVSLAGTLFIMMLGLAVG